MILYHGEIFDDTEQDRLIISLKDDLYIPFCLGKQLDRQTVINACDNLAQKVLRGSFDGIIKPYLEMLSITESEFRSMVNLFLRENLEYKCRVELCDEEQIIGGKFIRQRYPLGVLMHIAAGNIDVLPAYSVIEGLLAGNINILKLPAGDSGLSVTLLSELITAEPKLADYIYVFDVPSVEIQTLKKLAHYCDGVVVWGGDAAVAAARSIAGVSSKIISWGHKLSFAYADLSASDQDLKKLAAHICVTNQILCSSCQGIFVNTNNRNEQNAFAERFFKILKAVNAEVGSAEFGMRAKNAISIYNEKLEQHKTHNTIFSDNGVSVICTDDKELNLSYLYRNVWIKRLPLNEIIKTLKPYKGYLQTAGVLCPIESKQKQICCSLAAAGVVRITSAGNMSRIASGEAHDGCYALREYSRIVETELF